MRILLISTNRETLPDPVSPLGLAYIAAALLQAGHEVLLFDACSSAQPVADLEAELRTGEPDLVGVNIRNVDNVLASNLRRYVTEAAALVEVIQEWGRAEVLLGGSGFSLLPREMLASLNCRYGIAGEGERAAVLFVEALSGRRAFDEVPGLARLENGVFTLNPPQPEMNLDANPWPARGLLDNQTYSSQGGSGNVQSKRGCEFGCIYCTYPLLEGRRIRMRSPALVADEIETAAREFQIEHFYFVDNVFTHPAAHALAICQELIRRNLKIKWSCYGHPSRTILPLIEPMLRSGCQGVDFGTDTASAAQLKRMGKSFTQDEILEISEECRKAGLPFCHSLLLGGPGETLASAAETMDIIGRCDADAVVLLAGIRVFPGTELARIALREGITAPDQNWLEPVFYLSPDLDLEGFEKQLEQAEQRMTWVIPGRKRMFDERIQKKIRGYGFKGPLWEYIAKLRLLKNRDFLLHAMMGMKRG